MKGSKAEIKEKIENSKKWMKHHPSILVMIVLVVSQLVFQCHIIGLSFSSIEIFSLEAIAGVLGTAAEVIAGLYL